MTRTLETPLLQDSTHYLNRRSVGSWVCKIKVYRWWWKDGCQFEGSEGTLRDFLTNICVVSSGFPQKSRTSIGVLIFFRRICNNVIQLTSVRYNVMIISPSVLVFIMICALRLANEWVLSQSDGIRWDGLFHNIWIYMSAFCIFEWISCYVCA